MFKDATIEKINNYMRDAWKAYLLYRNCSLQQRAALMNAIADGLEQSGDELIAVTMEETQLPEARLKNERARTVFQLRSYAEACVQGNWLEARIDTGVPDRNPPKPDIRKMQMALGPVVVFGASNFPLAYSTAGGDTACALAAGCPVIVKAHPAHAQTSEMIAAIIDKAVEFCRLPRAVFTHVHGASFEIGKALVTHPLCKAVGFTGSYLGGKQLFDWANQRKEPIPVFAEMGSINPIFLLPGKLKESANEIATMCAGSVTLGVGQFCTKPGLIVAVDGPELNQFVDALALAIKNIAPGKMLHRGIAASYVEKRAKALEQTAVNLVAVSEKTPATAVREEGLPTIATATGQAFLKNPVLHQEVFGPYSIVIRCKDLTEMQMLAEQLEGQLTATFMATEEDIRSHPTLVEAVKNICGRFILNAVPTGVEVCLSMQHGGPFPATTDARFTSVGADGIKRFARPIAFQNWPDSLLPDELKNENPLKIYRTVNNNLTLDKI